MKNRELAENTIDELIQSARHFQYRETELERCDGYYRLNLWELELADRELQELREKVLSMILSED